MKTTYCRREPTVPFPTLPGGNRRFPSQPSLEGTVGSLLTFPKIENNCFEKHYPLKQRIIVLNNIIL